MPCDEMLREVGWECSAWRRDSFGRTFQYAEGGYPEDRVRPFTVVPGGEDRREEVELEKKVSGWV